MKTKINLLIIAAFALIMTLGACHTQDKKSTSTEQSTEQSSKQVTAQIAYQCPMKCEGDKTYDKAGKCPKCGMDLEKIKADSKVSDSAKVKQ